MVDSEADEGENECEHDAGDEADVAQDEQDEELTRKAASKPGFSSSHFTKLTTNVFWDDDLDLDDIYFKSAETDETMSELRAIEPDPILNPEVLFPQDENVPRSLTLEAEHPPIDLNLKEMEISADKLRDKLYGTTLFLTCRVRRRVILEDEELEHKWGLYEPKLRE